MRGTLLLALVGLVLGVGATAAAQTPSRTSLTVTYWSDGVDAGDRVIWTLHCNPAGGTHPRPAVACRRLAAASTSLFRPVPKLMVCTEIYGGPQVARVVGLVNGKRVWASFSRQNGCAIARWNRVSPWLLPPGGVT
jgi:Subtilisin inhibitor-like